AKGIDGGIRQTGRAVAAYTVPIKGVKPEVHMLLGHAEAGIPSHSTGVSGVVVSAYHRTGSTAQYRVLRRNLAGINAVAEPAEDTEYFIMSETGFSGGLDDNVGHGVEGIVGCVGTGGGGDGVAAGRRVVDGGGGASSDAGIVESGAHTVTAQGEIVISIGCGEGSLRIFQRRCQPEAIIEVFDHAGAVLPRKTEADIIVWVDGHRPGCA